MGSSVGAIKSAAKKLGISTEEWIERTKNGEKWCYCCRKWLPIYEFNPDRSSLSGLASNCKTCASHKGTASRYGITVEEARELRSGDVRCNICDRKRKLEVDHNHSTGKIRGVLCSRCNGALGQFRDRKELLIKAIEYLEENSG